MHTIQETQEVQNLYNLLTDNSNISHRTSYLNDGIQLTEKEFNITIIPLPCLLSKLSTGQITSLETVIAFLKKSLILSDQTTFSIKTTGKTLVEQVLEAVKRAEYLDFYFKRYGPIGPLHGLPISRDQLKAIGMEQDELYGVEIGQVVLDVVHYPDLSHSRRMSYNRWYISRRSKSF